MNTQIVPLAAVLALAGLVVVAVRYLLRREAASLVAVDREELDEEGRERRPGLRGWLVLAGFGSSRAPVLFLSATFAAMVTGLLGAVAFAVSPITRAIWAATGKWPWISGFLILSAQLGPLLVMVICASAPAVYVRAARRKRVDETEQDLPLFMDLFAALAEAGMGFDAALARILESHPARRTLAKEFTQYRKELMAGMSRAQGLRNLARRLNVLPLTLFVSAVIQAEQTGASIAQTLRNQAVDGRERRKIRVLLHANTQPVRLSFPLIICFLPGLLVTTLGPAIYHLLLIVNNMLGRIQ